MQRRAQEAFHRGGVARHGQRIATIARSPYALHGLEVSLVLHRRVAPRPETYRLGSGSSFLKECDDKLVHGPSDDPLWQSRARPSIN